MIVEPQSSRRFVSSSILATVYYTIHQHQKILNPRHVKLCELFTLFVGTMIVLIKAKLIIETNTNYALF